MERAAMSLFDNLIHEIQSGKPLETRSLARRLNTTPGMIQAILDHLTRSGRLKTVESCSSRACGGCGFSETCHAEDRPAGRVWAPLSGKALPAEQGNLLTPSTGSNAEIQDHCH
jgi:hypothetical protein